MVGAIPRYQRSGDEARVAWYVSQYDAEIRYMDAAFGRVDHGRLLASGSDVLPDRAGATPLASQRLGAHVGKPARLGN